MNSRSMIRFGSYYGSHYGHLSMIRIMPIFLYAYLPLCLSPILFLGSFLWSRTMLATDRRFPMDFNGL